LNSILASAVSGLNAALNFAFDLLLRPFSGLSPIWGLSAVSIVSGVLLVWIYGKCSNQARIKGIKRGIFASLLEALLFRRDLRVCLRAQGAMLVGATKYFLAAIPPLLVLMVPCILILAQLNMRYEARALTDGESLVLSVQATKGTKLDTLSITAPNELSVSPSVKIPSQSEVWWRVNTTTDGQFPLRIVNGTDELVAPIAVGLPTASLNPPRIWSNASTSWLFALLYPENAVLSQDSPIRTVTLRYPSAQHTILGITMHWILIFFLLSLISGLMAAKAFAIEV